MLCRIILDSHEVLRGSGTDLEVYLYQIKHQSNWRHRNVVGRAFAGDEFLDHGAVAGVSYRITLDVVAMGDGNGPDVAQECHEAILREASCMRDGEAMCYSDPLPIMKPVLVVKF